MLVAQWDQPGFDPDESDRLALVLSKIDAEACGRRRDHRHRLRVRLRPERPQLPQEDVGSDRADAVESEQAQFEIVRVVRSLMNLPSTAALIVNERLAVSQYLV